MSEDMEKKQKKHDENEDERKERDEKYYEKGEQRGKGIFISKNNLLLLAGGALGSLAAIGFAKISKNIRPAIVGTVKEGYTFKEWAAGKIDRVKEDAEDIVAEAKHAYHKDIEATAECVKKEKEILQKMESAVKKKASRKKAKKEEE